MKVIVLGIIVMGIIGMSVGFASNTVTLSLQDLGVGEEFVESPIADSNVKFTVAKVPVPGGGTRPAFKNVITKCLFKSDEGIAAPATIICKLLDGRNGPNQFGAVIAEGRRDLPGGYTANTTIEILITQKAFPFANEVVNIKGVKVVVLGPDPTSN